MKTPTSRRASPSPGSNSSPELPSFRQTPSPSPPSPRKTSQTSLFSILLITFTIGAACRLGMLLERMQQQSACLGYRSSLEMLTSQQQIHDGIIETEQRTHTECKCNQTAASVTKEPEEKKSAVNEQRNVKDIPRFSRGTSSFVHAVARTPKQNFSLSFDDGMPVHHNIRNNEQGQKEVLILYGSQEALPSDESIQRSARYHDGKIPPLLSPDDATANCDSMKVVMIGPGYYPLRECVALVGQSESYNVQRWTRVDEKEEHDASKPLVPIGAFKANMVEDYSEKAVTWLWDFLVSYLGRIPELKLKLSDALKDTAIDNTVIVMTCNLGQSELLINFACFARAHDVDLKNIIVFATDEETVKIAQGLNFATFYDEQLFGQLPKVSGLYGHDAFMNMMVATVISPHLISLLGYDFLFMDVDIVFYKNPLSILKSSSLREYDVIMQDDGNGLPMYLPYRGNAGFYFVRNNKKTQHMLQSCVFALDRLKDGYNDQMILNEALGHHRSTTGLRVKVLDPDMFPSGRDHRDRQDYMANMLKKKSAAMFHMNWTSGMHQKLPFMKQMGMWYVNENVCEKDNGAQVFDEVGSKGFMGKCCSAEPLVSCHYSNLPSIIPCEDSPEFK